MRQRRSHFSLESRSDCRFVASSKRRASPSRAHSSMDLCERLNAKRNQEDNLRAKLNNRIAATLDKVIIPEGSIARTIVLREPLPEVPNTILPRHHGMDPPQKFTPPKFTLYDEKLDLRSHGSHFRPYEII